MWFTCNGYEYCMDISEHVMKRKSGGGYKMPRWNNSLVLSILGLEIQKKRFIIPLGNIEDPYNG